MPVHSFDQVQDCLVCSITSTGEPASGGAVTKGYSITNEAVHDASTRHHTNIAQGKQFLPWVLAGARAPDEHYGHSYIRIAHTYRCEVCSLSPAGNPRRAHSAISTREAQSHFNGLQHARREEDGRLEEFRQRGTPWVRP